MQEGNSFHSLGPAKSIKCLRDSSLEIEFVTLVTIDRDRDRDRDEIEMR